MQCEHVNLYVCSVSCHYGAAICICFRHIFALSCIKLCRGRVGLQSGTDADKALHKYINFLECVRCGYYCPAKGYRTYFHASPIPTENIPKCLFFSGLICACSLHVQSAWQMFFLRNIPSESVNTDCFVYIHFFQCIWLKWSKNINIPLIVLKYFI